jgi:CRP-like cAMP-binding protein
MKPILNFHNYFQRLPKSTLDALLKLSHTKVYAPNEAIYRRGDAANAMYQIISGNTRMINHTYDGKEVVDTTLHKGDCFGELGLIDGFGRSHDMVAITETKIRILNKAGFNEIYDNHPDFVKVIVVTLAYRLRYFLSQSEEATILSMSERFSRMLQKLTYSQGVEQENGDITIVISQQEMGQILGASRQCISKHLKSLSNKGIVETRRNRLIVKDVARLTTNCDSFIGGDFVTPAYQEI